MSIMEDCCKSICCSGCLENLGESDFYLQRGKPRNKCKKCVYVEMNECRKKRRRGKANDPVGDGGEELKWCRCCLMWIEKGKFYKCRDKSYTYCVDCCREKARRYSKT